MTAPCPSRRAILAGMATMPVAAAAPALAAIGIADPFGVAHATYVRLRDAAKRYDATVTVPARRAIEAAVARLPHVSASFTRGGGGTVSTARPGDVETARYLLPSIAGRFPGPRLTNADDGGYQAAMRKVRAHALWRDRARQRISKAAGWPAIHARSDTNWDEVSEAQDAVIAAPAGSVAQLLRKIEFAEAELVHDDPNLLASVKADLRALGATGKALRS